MPRSVLVALLFWVELMEFFSQLLCWTKLNFVQSVETFMVSPVAVQTMPQPRHRSCRQHLGRYQSQAEASNRSPYEHRKRFSGCSLSIADADPRFLAMRGVSKVDLQVSTLPSHTCAVTRYGPHFRFHKEILGCPMRLQSQLGLLNAGAKSWWLQSPGTARSQVSRLGTKSQTGWANPESLCARP